jgi:pyruvate kinase
MLSAETSIGRYPVRAVTTMAKIARETEKRLPYEQMLRSRGSSRNEQIDEMIAYNACRTAHYLRAAAIVAFTQSGSTASRVSKYRPGVPILAETASDVVAGRLMLYWGVYPFAVGETLTLDDLFTGGARLARDLRLAKPGDLIVITGGIPIGVAGSTNLLKVEQITS